MSKLDKFNEASTEVKEVLVGVFATHRVAEPVQKAIVSAVEAQLEKHFKPSNGSRVDLDSVTRKDAEGNVIELQCSLSGAWLPANTVYFFSDKGSSIGLRRVSRQAQAIANALNAKVEASKKAINSDLLGLDFNAPDGRKQAVELQNKLKELELLKPDYSTVGLVAPETNEGTEPVDTESAE